MIVSRDCSPDPVRKLQRPLCQVQSYRRQHTASIAGKNVTSSVVNFSVSF